MWLLLLLILSISSPAYSAIYGDYTRKSGGGLSSVSIQDEGTAKGSVSTFNFTGAGVSAVVTGDTTTVNVTGGGGSGSTNSFETIDVPAGTDPVADSATDTLTITETSPLVITGTAGTDTVDITWTTLTVAEGGTGATSLTDGGILLGSGTGAITALGAATNGQIPIGDGTTAPALGTLTGTANEIDVSNGAGSITVGIADPLQVSKGGTGISAATDDTTIVGNGTIFGGALLPNCTDASGNHLNYTQSSNAFSCGTTSSIANVFQTTSNVANLVTSTDNLSIGSSSNLAKISADGDTDEIQLLAQGNATQTANIFVIERSDGTDIATADTTTFSVAPTMGLAVPVSASQTPKGAGRVSVDTTDDQFLYYGTNTRVIPYHNTDCVNIENLKDTDDNMPIKMFNDGVNIMNVGCSYVGTGSTLALITFEDGSGNLIGVNTGYPTCVPHGTNATFRAATQDTASAIVSGEIVRFDVVNTPNPTTDLYTVCVDYVSTAE